MAESARPAPAARTLRRISLDIRTVLVKHLGGTVADWAVTSCSPDDWSFTQVTGRLAPADSVDDVHTEAVELCRQRYVTGASHKVMRDTMPRSVPWDIVTVTMAPCSDLHHLPLHSMHRFALLLVQRSQSRLLRSTSASSPCTLR
eukprot:TRINITY_DN6611_c0_g1_i1.p1 TRINITY_DN6611_c0_g1~~TRINITY_DN6611_c0_g1_i1.p1  ORF type:complete len:145 (+),score=8.79 TRINITY_DN6611_c0_g1_i1:113-547(+)